MSHFTIAMYLLYIIITNLTDASNLLPTSTLKIRRLTVISVNHIGSVTMFCGFLSTAK